MIHKTTRSILSVLLAALLLVTSVPLTPAFADGGAVSLQSESAEGRALDGDGTKDNPYQIATADDLLKFAQRVNGTDGNSADPGAHAKLMNDIDLSGICSEEDGVSWTPIGNSSNNQYTGTFNGQNFKISGLTINNSSANYQGLFGYVDTGGIVQNLSVSGSVKGDDYVGGVVGDNRGSVEDCDFTGSVSGNSYVGGVVGVVGDSSGSVKNCYNTGAVSSLDSGSGNSVGGVVGYNDIGGSVTNCYNTGSVNGSIEAGGVVGSNSLSATVTNCYNTGEVSGMYVGGVVGYNDGPVKNCYNTGSVSGKISVGGVVGYNDGGSVTGCYFLKDTAKKGIGSGNASTENVKSLTADQFKKQENFTNWEFGTADTWTIHSVLGRPVLNENWEGGDGSPESPYEISTADQLKNFRDIVNGASGNPAAWAVLMENITLNSSEEWEPIGNSIGNSYEGTFDGNGHTISGLYIKSSSDNYQGLFGYVYRGTVQNLSVSGDINGYKYVGGIVGYNNGGNVTGCTFSGSGSVSGSYYVGGIVGYNGTGATVSNCYNTGTGTVTGNDYVGGVVGQNFGGVENCYNTGTGTVTGNDFVGGVVGQNFDGTVENCYNTRTVSGSDYVGGVVGDNISSVTNCYNTGTVTSSGNSVGGVVGYNYGGRVENCYNTGSVSDGTTSGGVVGQNSGTVTNCYFLQQNGVPAQGIGSGSGTSSNVEARTAAAFHSGEVAHLLGEAWGQSALGTDNSWPTLVALDNSAKTVYKVTVDYNYDGAQNKTTYTNDPAKPAAPAREGYTFGGWDKTGEGTTTITYTAKWTENAPDPDPEPTPDPEPEEPPYTGKYSYELSTSVGDHGSLTVDRYATEGDKVTIDVTPDEAYKLDDLSVTANGKDVELTANSDGTYTFTMPSADVRITATFAEDPDWTEPEEPATDVSDIFLDVAPNAWYKDAVQYAYDNGLMTGVSATEFAPEATTTRAMIVSILARLENVTTAEAAGFADVDDNDWYATAVNWAANVGVVNGYEDNTFRPNTAITREQLAAILMNYAAYKGEDVSNRADLDGYTDQPSTWAQEAMQWAVAEGLISGVTADTLQPQGAATRAQVAAILQRFLSE